MVTTIRAIETAYQGYRFRSRLEARWAVFFDALGVGWEYEKEGFDLGDGVRYLPDFWLPAWAGWVEIKPGEPDREERDKAARLVPATGHRVLVVGGQPWPGQYAVTLLFGEEDDGVLASRPGPAAPSPGTPGASGCGCRRRRRTRRGGTASTTAGAARPESSSWSCDERLRSSRRRRWCGRMRRPAPPGSSTAKPGSLPPPRAWAPASPGPRRRPSWPTWRGSRRRRSDEDDTGRTSRRRPAGGGSGGPAERRRGQAPPGVPARLLQASVPATRWELGGPQLADACTHPQDKEPGWLS